VIQGSNEELALTSHQACIYRHAVALLAASYPAFRSAADLVLISDALLRDQDSRSVEEQRSTPKSSQKWYITITTMPFHLVHSLGRPVMLGSCTGITTPFHKRPCNQQTAKVTASGKHQAWTAMRTSLHWSAGHWHADTYVY